MLEDEVFQIATRYLKRARRGANSELSASCPFHRKADGSEEKSPSFNLNLSKGVYYCHSCHVSGNFMAFLREVGLPRDVVAVQYEPLLDALRKNRAPDFNPLTPARVFNQEPMKEAVLGLFEECPLALVDPDQRIDVDDPVFDEALLQRQDIGYDRKHHRITFPLRDLQGNLIGISGRTTIDEQPRYKVYTTEYAEFELPVREATSKGSILWNAHNIYSGVFYGPPTEHVVIVEGFKACLWLLQAGVRNTVAMLGSGMSEQQQWILERMGARVYLMLDNDKAGQNALCGYISEKTGRWRPGIAETLSKSLDVFIVPYTARQPTGLQLEEVHAAIAAAEDYYVWNTKNSKRKNNLYVLR
jgi:DNA primase